MCCYGCANAFGYEYDLVVLLPQDRRKKFLRTLAGFVKSFSHFLRISAYIRCFLDPVIHFQKGVIPAFFCQFFTVIQQWFIKTVPDSREKYCYFHIDSPFICGNIDSAF